MIRFRVAAALHLLLSSAALSRGALVEYNWTLRQARASSKDPSLSVDCNLDRMMLLINDEYPGPTLRANVGDTVRINLVNEDPNTSFTLHHHGLHMFGQPYYDGAASASQCATGVQQTQVYEFQVNEVGTHYWHGHMAMERGDGYQGAIIVTNPNDEAEQELEAMYDGDEIIFLQDWYHMSGPELQAGLDSTPFIWVGNAQTFAINGGALYPPCYENTTTDPTLCADNCSIENYIKTIEVENGETYRLRLIGGQILIGVNFAIANHTMTVVEVEGTLCEPFEVTSLDVMPGQRYSVLVTFDQEPNSYWATTSVRYRSSGPGGSIIFKYKSAPDASLTLDGPFPEHPSHDDHAPTLNLEAKLATKNVESYADFDVLTVNEGSIRRFVIVGTQATDIKTGKLRWALNNVTYDMPSKPFILSAYDAVKQDDAKPWPNTSIPGSIKLPHSPPNPWNYSESVHGIGTYNGDSGASIIPVTEGEVIEIVMQNARALNNVTEMHPWHLHGFSFFVVGMGDGGYEETSPSTYNLVNPIRRDTFTLLPNGWTAIRFRADNVGVWPFHCVIPPHLVMGMEALVVVSPDKLDSPPPGSRSCTDTSLANNEGDMSEENQNFTDVTSAASQVDPIEESYDSVEDDGSRGNSASVSIMIMLLSMAFIGLSLHDE